MQDTPGLGDGLYDREWHVDSEVEISEDCLYLNVWTPAKATTDKLPALLWLELRHGGVLERNESCA